MRVGFNRKEVEWKSGESKRHATCLFVLVFWRAPLQVSRDFCGKNLEAWACGEFFVGHLAGLACMEIVLLGLRLPEAVVGGYP